MENERYVTEYKLGELFSMTGIKLTKEDFQFVVLKLFEYNKSLKKLDVLKLFEIFASDDIDSEQGENSDVYINDKEKNENMTDMEMDEDMDLDDVLDNFE